jgi:putative chitobiose transport system permease protein
MSPALRKRGVQVASTIAGIAVAWVFVWPTLWLLTSAFRPNRDIFAYLSPFSVFSLVPNQITLANFTAVFAEGFARPIENSLIVATVTMVVGLLLAVPAAFALGVLRFPFRRLAFVVLFVGFSVPFDLVAIPLSGVFREWGLANSYTGLILPGLANGFAILLLRQFFANLPAQLHESARVDGASWFRVLVQIYIPLAWPALVTAAMTLFLFQWQAYLWPLLVADQPNIQLGPVALAGLQGGYIATDFGAIFAGAAMLVAVPTVLMLCFQRQFVSSIASTGLSG